MTGGCVCQKTCCQDGRCSCVRNSRHCSDAFCGCDSSRCKNEKGAAAAAEPPKNKRKTTAQEVWLTRREPRKGGRRYTVDLKCLISLGHEGERTTAFVVPSDVTFGRLAREAADWFHPDGFEGEAILCDADDSVCGAGFQAALQQQTLERGLVLKIVERDEAADDGAAGVGSGDEGVAPATPPTPRREEEGEQEEERERSPSPMPRLVIATRTLGRHVHSGAFESFPGLGSPAISTAISPMIQRASDLRSIPAAPHIGRCRAGCLFAIGTGGRVFHVDERPFAGDPPRRLFGHFVVTDRGRVFEVSVSFDADGANVSASQVPLPDSLQQIEQITETETDYYLIARKRRNLFKLAKSTPLPFQPIQAFEFTQIAAASTFLVALSPDGRAFVDGNASNAGFRNCFSPVEITLPAGLRSHRIRSVACGCEHVLLLLANGAVLSFGCSDEGRLGLGKLEESTRATWTPHLISAFPGTPAAQDPAVSVAAGHYHSACLTASGELWTWGQGKFGQLGHGDQRNRFTPERVAGLAESKVVEVACEKLSTVALDMFGSVFTFGFSTAPLVVEGYSIEKLASQPRIAIVSGNIAKVSASGKGFCLALRGGEEKLGTADAPIDV